MIMMLEDPDQRLDALRSVQAFPAGRVVPPFEVTLREREAALAARPDVRAAVQRVGRFEHQTIPQS
jgi:hypothetical protein